MSHDVVIPAQNLVLTARKLAGTVGDPAGVSSLRIAVQRGCR